MREALDSDEGLVVADLDESGAIEKLREEGLRAPTRRSRSHTRRLNQGSARLVRTEQILL